MFYSIILLTVLGATASQVELDSVYELIQTVGLSDIDSKTFSYQITAKAVIEKIQPELLLIKLKDLKFLCQSKGASNFKPRTSVLDAADNNEFFIETKDGKINKIHIASSEDLPIVNLKKSFSSLLQFQVQQSQTQENGLNGNCQVNYELIGNSAVKKTKSNCQTDTTSLKGDIWSALITPKIETTINLADNKLISILHKEDYKIKSSIAEFTETSVSVTVDLKRIGTHSNEKRQLSDENVETLIQKTVGKLGKDFISHDLAINTNLRKSDSEEKELSTIIKENLNFLANNKLGTKDSAIAGLKLLHATKKASFKEIHNVLKAKSNKQIVEQLLDIIGAVQTSDSHKAAMKYLNIKSKDLKLDLWERYLWALSTSAHCNKEVIKDLIQLLDNEITNQKLLETLVQTVSSMVKKYSSKYKENELLETTLHHFTNKLKACSKTDELCQRTYLKAFTNIGSSKVTDLLIEYVFTASKRSSVQAMKALKKCGPSSWNKEVIRAAERVYLSNGTYDSSAKTIALDILLETSSPSFFLHKLVQPLKIKSGSVELKEYLLQRLEQISENNNEYKKHFKSLLQSEGLYNYNGLAQGGLSTAFDREFMENGFLSTTQEVNSGILKQGYVDINLKHNGKTETIFTLGLFSNGLSSFVSDNSEEDSDGEVNAGLELTVLGVEFRPFVFFEGHGELMGHVFSGTGSTLTPAYQAILLLNDEVGYLPIGTGDLVSIAIFSVASVDLSGKIEISLWGRTANSLVQNSAGIVLNKSIEIISPYVNLEKEIQLTAEPQLKLSSNINFYDKVALCLQLEQPQSIIQYNSSVGGKIQGGTYKVRSTKHGNIVVPGKTYALNSKNNELCNILFKN